jgi:hypothetical protein
MIVMQQKRNKVRIQTFIKAAFIGKFHSNKQILESYLKHEKTCVATYLMQ